MKLKLVIVFLCVTASVFILQGAFDRSDHQKAERALQNYTLAGKVFGPFVQSHMHDKNGEWSSEITHGCRGIVRVRYTTPSEVAEFDYDVPNHGIHPANAIGLSLLEQFAGPANPHPPDGGVPHGGL